MAESGLDKLVRLGLVEQDDANNHIEHLKEVVSDLKDTVAQKEDHNDQAIAVLSEDPELIEKLCCPFALMLLRLT